MKQPVKPCNCKRYSAKLIIEKIRAEFSSEIQERVAKVFKISDDFNDLALEVVINNWGWIIPQAGVFGIKLGTFQLEVHGSIYIYDLKLNKKLIAEQVFTARENISDHLSKSENERAIKKIMRDASELIGEFVWRSDAKSEALR